MKRYVFIYYYGTDQDILIAVLTAEEIREQVKRFQLTEYDYCIVDGEVLKGFNNKTFDLENLQ